MKKAPVLKLFSLVAFAAAGAFAVFSSKKAVSGNAVVPGSALDDPTYSGSIIVEKNAGDARWDGCNLTSYLFVDENTHTWGPVVQNTNSQYQVYSWEGLSFEPTKIILLRVPTNWSSDWENPWWSGDGGIYARTGNVTLQSNRVVWMAGNASETEHWGTYDVKAVVKGYDKDSGGSEVLDYQLPSIKINGNGVLEAYGEVALPANTYFKILKADSFWCNSYSAHSSVASNFETVEGGNENIHNTAGGTYEFFFAYNDATLYITDPIRAAADEWAQSFIAGNCSASMTGWSTFAGTYASMPDGSKALFVAEAHIAHDAEATTFIASAVQRYDYVIERYGTNPYNDFMGRVTAGKVTPGPASSSNVISNNNVDSNNLIVIVSIVSLISASTLVGLIVIKRRRGIAK